MTVTVITSSSGGGKVTDLLQTSTVLNITLASLATSATTLVGRQSDIIQNTNKEQWLRLYIKLTQGTTPTANKGAYVYLLTGDGTHRTDGAGALDAGLTILNAPLVGTIRNKSSGTATGDVMYKEITVRLMTPEWGIMIAQDTAVALDATAANHWVRYQYVSPTIG